MKHVFTVGDLFVTKYTNLVQLATRIQDKHTYLEWFDNYNNKIVVSRYETEYVVYYINSDAWKHFPVIK